MSESHNEFIEGIRAYKNLKIGTLPKCPYKEGSRPAQEWIKGYKVAKNMKRLYKGVDLLNRWLNDESGYDEKAWPEPKELLYDNKEKVNINYEKDE